MSINFGLEKTLEYIAEAALELFSPNHDTYPLTGIQPFDGEPWKESRHK
ncbi:isochorismate synthase [Lyngbya aestuarii]